jgi:sulfatase modifying factor 1
MGTGGNAGATGAAGGGGTNIAESTATGGGSGGAVTGSGGAILSGGTSASSGGAGGGTTAGGGIASSGGSLVASGGTTGTSGGGSATGGNAGGSGGQSGGSIGTGGGGGSASGGSAGQKSSRSGGSTGTGGAAAGAGGSTGGAAGSGGAAGTGGTVAPCGGCQPLEVCSEGRICVAKSVQIPPNPNPFLIDATEVTRGQYAAWLATNPTPADIWQDPTCSWNTSFSPDATCMTRSSVCKGADCANHPQVCIDVCDAVAYCSAIGKHLCSAYEWSNACTSNGVNQFTYGNSIGVGQCHDTTEPNSSTTVPVGTMPGCQSPVPGFAGIFDLIGNVSEWVADCTGSAGATDSCQSRGGSFGLSEVMPDCSQSVGGQRAYFSDRIGFRCSISLVH